MKKLFLLIPLFLMMIVINYNHHTVTYVRTIDGDTAVFMIDDTETTVRFLAIDTPESVHPYLEEEAYGKEASSRCEELLSNASKITLEYEQDKEDDYGRVLAWVFIDGELLQEILVKEGYGEVAYLYDEYKYTYLLEIAQDDAKENKLNIWS